MKIFELIKKNMIVNKSELITYSTVPIGMGLLGLVLSLVIYGVNSEEYVEFATAFALMGGLFLLAFAMLFSERQSFTLAVTMGIARKRYLPARYVSVLAKVLIAWIEMVLVFGLDYFVENTLAADSPHESILGLINMPSYLIVVITLAYPILCLFLGIMYIKYEKKFFWVMWALWMIACLGGPRLSSAMETRPESAAAKIGFALAKFFGMNSLAMTGIVIVIAAILGVITARLYKTETITV